MDAKLLLPFLFLLASCAQPVVPTGGNKDEKGPSITSVKISRGTSTQVTLAFDENVVSDQADQSIIISPATTIKPVIKSIQHGLSITIDTLMPDRFQVQFLPQAIKDLNEKNPMTDTIMFIQGTRTLDSIPTLYYHSGNVQSSYQLTRLEKLSVYIGNFQNFPSSLLGFPYTKTDKNGTFLLPVFDSSTSHLLLLKDNNNNHRIDSGETFHVIFNHKPQTFIDTTAIHYLPTDIPTLNPIAERIYFGYRIHGFKGYSHHEYLDIPTFTKYISQRPMVTIMDTAFLLSDTLAEIPFRPFYTQPRKIIPKKNLIKHSTNHQLIPNPGNRNIVHIAFSKPIAESSNLVLMGPDSLQITPDSKVQAPFLLTIHLPSQSYNSISVPDSAIQFTDGSFFKKQVLSIPPPKDTVVVSFKRNNDDTAYYLIQVRSKSISFYHALEYDQISLRLPVDAYSFLIMHDKDRNGFITPSSLLPYKPQEYHYTIPNYILRKGIDTEETIKPQR